MMENLLFENQGTSTFLVYEVREQDELDTMSLGMLTNNRIPGFAAAAYMQIDTTKYIKYNVSAKVSAKQLFSGPVNKKRLLGVFCGVVDAMLNAEEYMLDQQSILLDLDYIFTDVSSCAAELICVPIMNLQQSNPSPELFFKNILFTTQFDQTENCDHVAQLINYLNGNPILSLVDFKELLDNLDRGGCAQTNVPRQVPQPMVNPQPVQRTAPVQTAPVQAAPRPVQQPVKAVPTPPPAAVQQRQKPPVAVPPANPAAPVQQQAASDEKPMSFFYLMQHYNKENAAIYKSQQEAKKTKKAETEAPAAKTVPQKATPPQSGAGFAVPGKQEPITPAFAVPGQQAKPSSTAVKHDERTGNVNTVPTPSASEACVKCGHIMLPNQAFCTSCGTRRASAPAPQPAVVQQGNPINFGETTVLGGGAIGETTVLGGSAQPNKMDPHLIRTKNNEKIPLNKPVFRIGKERSYVDYFVSDNTAISRSHANIVNHNGEFFVVDTNSTNHTYVNGGMIPSNVETRLSHGTKIRLANEDFEFRLY